MDTDTYAGLMDNSSQDNTDSVMTHVVNIMKAAFPFLDSDTQQSVGLIIKSEELIHSFQNVNNTVSAFSIRKKSIDLEGLLKGIREVCYPNEREIIDMLLNVFQAKKFFETYNTIKEAMASQTDKSENSDSKTSNIFGMNSNANMSEILDAFLTPEQKSTFENLSMMMNLMQQQQQ